MQIIDGIDVTKCKHCMYQGFRAFPQCRLNLDSFATACEQHKDCYYKQLKRAEQENEKLKEEIKLAQELSDQSIEYFGNSREEFKKKSHRYKQALMDIREICKLDCGDCKYNQNCECNFEECEELKLEDIITKINEVIGAEE